jgi:hypothetical protein
MVEQQGRIEAERTAANKWIRSAKLDLADVQEATA